MVEGQFLANHAIWTSMYQDNTLNWCSLGIFFINFKTFKVKKKEKQFGPLDNIKKEY